MYARVYCKECFLKAQAAGRDKGKSVKKHKSKAIEDVRLYQLMREVLNEEKGVKDDNPAKNMLRTLRDESPSKFIDQMTKLEPKVTGEGGPRVIVVYLPQKGDVGANCPPPTAATKEAVESLVMELEDRK